MSKSRSEKFSDTQIRPKICHYHTFGCPSYALNTTNAITKGKWIPRAHLEITWHITTTCKICTPHFEPNDLLSVSIVPRKV
jgi:hypothetical protein